MAFDFLRFLGPEAANRLMMPQFMGGPNRLEQPMAAPLPAPVNVGPAPGMNTPQVQTQADPMQTAATQPMGQMPVAQAQSGGGFGINKELLNDIFLGWAMGQTPMQSLSLGAAQASKGKSGRQNLNQTVEWLKSKGMDDGQARMIASSPGTLQEYLKTIITPQDPMKQLQLQKTQLEIQNMQNPTAKLTDDQREYQAAKDQGFDGTFMDYMVKMKEAGRQQVNIDTGVKLPAGYQWVDPNDQAKGVQPIPGGPATQIPGELAARVGMSESFAGQAPALREKLMSGDMTGPIDSLMGQFGIGQRGEAYRQMQSGADALMRLLTGAGMNETEARAYAERYLPTMKDTPESAAGKLDQLMRELESAKGMAMRGRGGSAPGAAPAAPAQGGGVVDYRQYFGGQ